VHDPIKGGHIVQIVVGGIIPLRKIQVADMKVLALSGAQDLDPQPFMRVQTQCNLLTTQPESSSQQ
jgi:hypothetical protein